LKRAGTLKRAGALQRAPALNRTTPRNRTTALQRAISLNRTAALERISASKRTIAARTATTLHRATWTLRASLGVLRVSILLVALLRVPLTALQCVRLSLRVGDTAIENRERSNQTLRPKCNFIHKSHRVPHRASANSD
jgi:hypothetical protein